MLYIVGLGLSDVEDITIKGLKAVQESQKVYLEHYTSILGGGQDYVSKLEQFYGKSLILADRTMVEQNCDAIIDEARTAIVSFLVVGDPFGATTHTDLVLRAIEKGVEYKIIHNASIMNACGCAGLQLYNFGESVSICFWCEAENWRPKSYLDKVVENRRRGLHTLCLLDIKVKEKSVENLIKGRDIYEPPRFMRVHQACAQIMDILNDTALEDHNDDEEESKEAVSKDHRSIINENTLCVGLARVGRDDQLIRVDSLKGLTECDMGEPLHSLIVVGKLHPLEVDFIKLYFNKNSSQSFDELVQLNNKLYS